MLVIIDDGSIVGIHTPPAGGTRFLSDDDWIRHAIVSAYEHGLADGERGQQPLRAPDGWVLWSALRAGDIATSGQWWVAISDTKEFKFANGGCNARRFAHVEIGGDNQVDERFNFDPAQRRSWPFYRVARAGLTGAQILDLLDAVAAAPADVAAGAASPDQTSCAADLHAWLRRELPRVTRPLKHGGNYRYLFPLEPFVRRRLAKMPTLPYPKITRPA